MTEHALLDHLARCQAAELIRQVQGLPEPEYWFKHTLQYLDKAFFQRDITKATPLKAPGASSSLLRAQTSTLLADASFPGRTVTIVGFDVGETDWPLRASFVLFMRNVVELARLHRAQGTTGPAKTGDPLRIAVPKDVTSVKVDGPGLVEKELAAKGGFAILPTVDRAGVYHARWTVPRHGSAVIIANLTSDKESDVRPRKVVVDANAGVVTAARVADAHHEWGLWLALAALAFIAFDIFWLTRKKNVSSVGSVAAATARPAPKPEAPAKGEA